MPDPTPTAIAAWVAARRAEHAQVIDHARSVRFCVCDVCREWRRTAVSEEPAKLAVIAAAATGNHTDDEGWMHLVGANEHPCALCAALTPQPTKEGA